MVKKHEINDEELGNVNGGLVINQYTDLPYNTIGIYGTEYKYDKEKEAAVFACIAATTKRLGYKDDNAALADLLANNLIYE